MNNHSSVELLERSGRLRNRSGRAAFYSWRLEMMVDGKLTGKNLKIGNEQSCILRAIATKAPLILQTF